MHSQSQHCGTPASGSACCRDPLPGCFHTHPAKRLKLRSHAVLSRAVSERARVMVCSAHASPQLHAAAVAERPVEAPTTGIPVQQLTSSKSQDLLRIRHSVSHLLLVPEVPLLLLAEALVLCGRRQVGGTNCEVAQSSISDFNASWMMVPGRQQHVSVATCSPCWSMLVYRHACVQLDKDQHLGLLCHSDRYHFRCGSQSSKSAATCYAVAPRRTYKHVSPSPACSAWQSMHLDAGAQHFILSILTHQPCARLHGAELTGQPMLDSSEQSDPAVQSAELPVHLIQSASAQQATHASNICSMIIKPSNSSIRSPVDAVRPDVMLPVCTVRPHHGHGGPEALSRHPGHNWPLD